MPKETRSSACGSAALSIGVAMAVFACGGDSGSGPNGGALNPQLGDPLDPLNNVCGAYADWETSDYVLPYPVGTAYGIQQANCSGFGHSTVHKYGYDFDMEIGTVITAARAGRVVEIRNQFMDGQIQPGQENLVKIIHDDGTTAAYSHLTQGGALVNVGDVVAAGDTIGLSGNTGNTGNVPHLHFHVSPCDEPVPNSCGTLPVTFRNTAPNPRGLLFGTVYAARAF